MRYRRGETQTLWFRTGRVVRVDGRWYFNTREGIDVGPYATELEAEIEAELLVQALRDVSPEDAPRAIRDFAYRSVTADSSGDFLNCENFTDYVVKESATELTIDELFSAGR